MDIATVNPYRYRSYYYDSETALYYLQSRYYDPETGRFLNADEAIYLTIFDSILNMNLFAYCQNNPVNMVDVTGGIPRWIITGVINLANATGIKAYTWSLYQVAKNSIAIAANVFLASKGYKLSCALFNHGMWGNGRKPGASINKLIKKRLKNSSSMKKAISDILASETGDYIDKTSWVEFIANNKTNADLYYSLQHVTFKVKGEKIEGVWNLKVTVSNCYDFDSIRSFSNLSFGNAANDLGWAMQRIGMMIPYNISVTYSVKVNE